MANCCYTIQVVSKPWSLVIFRIYVHGASSIKTNYQNWHCSVIRNRAFLESSYTNAWYNDVHLEKYLRLSPITWCNSSLRISPGYNNLPLMNIVDQGMFSKISKIDTIDALGAAMLTLLTRLTMLVMTYNTVGRANMTLLDQISKILLTDWLTFQLRSMRC